MDEVTNNLIKSMEKEFGHRICDATKGLPYLTDQLDRAANAYAASRCKNMTALKTIQEKSSELLAKALFIAFLVNWDLELNGTHEEPASVLKRMIDNCTLKYAPPSINATYKPGTHYEGD